MNDIPVLSILIFLPIVAGLICLFLPGQDGGNLSRIVALLASLISLVVAVVVLVDFAPGETAMRFEETVEWIPQFGISYHLGADGLNILLIALTAILTPSAILASWDRAGDR
ncbi:MAG: NADH-quinone oxidoreductase subunit M, partial [Thermomicrobiales bacterium]